MLNKPSLYDIPDAEENLSSVSEFLAKFDPIPYFSDIWGESYRSKAEGLWEMSIQSFKRNNELDYTWQELILIIHFDFALGPFLGLPEKIKLKFYPWVFEQLKNKIQD